MLRDQGDGGQQQDAATSRVTAIQTDGAASPDRGRSHLPMSITITPEYDDDPAGAAKALAVVLDRRARRTAA